MRRKGNPCNPDGNIDQYSYYGKQYGGFSQNKKKKDLPHDLVIPFLDTYPKGTEIRILKRYLHFHVHCSITYKSQDMEIAEMSIDG